MAATTPALSSSIFAVASAPARFVQSAMSPAASNTARGFSALARSAFCKLPEARIRGDKTGKRIAETPRRQMLRLSDKNVLLIYARTLGSIGNQPQTLVGNIRA